MLIERLKSGTAPERLALCISLGFALGMVPALGTATLLCTLAAFVFRLNLPVIQLVNLVTYPLQLALLIPFIRAGEWLFGAESANLSLEAIRQMFQAGLWNTVVRLGSATLHALTVWILIAPLIVVPIYFAMAPLLRKLRPEGSGPAS